MKWNALEGSGTAKQTISTVLFVRFLHFQILYAELIFLDKVVVSSVCW